MLHVLSFSVIVMMMTGLVLSRPSEAAAQIQPPERRCADIMACEYGEINHAYTVQWELGCGANCSESYWVRDRETGRVLVEVVGVRAAIIAVHGLGSQGQLPDVRVFEPQYGRGDPMCCPGAIRARLYVWSPGLGELAVAEERMLPTQDVDFAGIRQELTDQGWIVYSK